LAPTRFFDLLPTRTLPELGQDILLP
jgi:hypothetical protein